MNYRVCATILSIIMMDPKDVDPSDPPLTSIAALHTMGTPQVVSE